MIALLMALAALGMQEDSPFSPGWLESHYRHQDNLWWSAWQPEVRPVRSEWCEANIRLPGDISADPGPYSFNGREYLREIIDSIDVSEVREVVFVGGTQIGKTEAIRAMMTSQGEVDAAPMMLAGPDMVYAREQREFVYKVCEASPALRGRIPPQRLRNDRWIDLGKCYVYLAWSGSTQRLSGRSCKVVLCSEVDRWSHSVNLARQRTKAFWRSCVVFEGTPVGESPTLWDLWLKSDRRTFRVPCPVCGHYQELRFFPHTGGAYARCGGVAGMKDREGNWLTPAQAAEKAYYICEKGCRIEQNQKPWMIARGVWAPDGCDVVNGKVVGNPKHPSRRRGYRLSSLYSPTISLGDAAAEWITVRETEEGKQSFFNDWLALRFETRGKVPRWSSLGVKIRGAHGRGVVPPQAVFLTAGADVQENSVYWSVRGWGDGGTSWLVDWGRIERDVDEDGDVIRDSALVKLAETVLNRTWRVAGSNRIGMSELKILRMAIDGGYQLKLIHEFVKRLRDPRVIITKGDPHLANDEPYRFSLVEKNQRTGKAYVGGLRLWLVNSSYYKGDIQDRWQEKIDQPGFWFSTNASNDEAESYLRQITNEARIVEISPKTKHPKEVWKIIDETIGNHWFDTEVYSAACADMVVERVWDNLSERFQAAMSTRGGSDERQSRSSFLAGRSGFIRSSGGSFIRR